MPIFVRKPRRAAREPWLVIIISITFIVIVIVIVISIVIVGTAPSSEHVLGKAKKSSQ